MSFHNFFSEDFLLSSSLKPKSFNGSNDSGKVVVGDGDEKESISTTRPPEPEAKRICVPASVIKATTAVEQSIPSSSVPSPIPFLSSSSAESVTTPHFNAPILSSSSPQSLSDQILQVRIKLQIYQKEYVHFAECANRSALQIQGTLEELHKLVNLNFDAEPNKSKIALNDVPSSSQRVQNLSYANPIISAPTPNIVQCSPAKQHTIIINSVKHRPRAFPRKPRCLIFNTNQPAFSDLMVTSSLDGSVQLWSKSEQKIKTSLYLPSYLHKPYFVEDLCWDRQGSGLLALGICESANAPVNDDLNSSNSNRSDRQIAFLQFNNRDPSVAPKFIYSSLTPHDRNISVIESWSSNKHSSNNEASTSNFLTGGLDKAIFSWKVVRSDLSRDPQITAQELHRRHTSSVQAICYDAITCDIWSGGADSRIIQWSGEGNRLVNELRWDSRISHLVKTKNHPNLMLATVTSMSSQLRLFDTRINNIVHSFGIQESSNRSRYVHPSWHPDGNLISNGTLSPTDSICSINIWDIRMMRNNNNSTEIKPVKVINCDDRRFVRTEFAPEGDCLVGMATDGYMTFVDLTAN